MESLYFCAVCLRPFNSDPHTLPNGEDCHARCCPVCKRERRNRGADPPAPHKVEEVT